MSLTVRKMALALCAFACCSMGQSLVATASSAKKAAPGSNFLMFEEKHLEKYYDGKIKVKGVIAQVCELPAGQKKLYTCPKGSKQAHVKYGVWKWFWPNGEKLAERKYDLQGHLTGKARSWFATGNIRWEESYKEGKLEGTRTVYFRSGSKKLEADYKAGKRDGQFASYWWNGKRASEGKYAEGKRIGTWKTYYTNGDLKEVINYANGKRHGAYVMYRSICQQSGCSSVKTVAGSYKKGQKEGKWYRWFFDANGRKRTAIQNWSPVQ